MPYVRSKLYLEIVFHEQFVLLVARKLTFWKPENGIREEGRRLL